MLRFAIVLLLLVFLGLAGCGLFGDKKQPLPGERISVLSLDRQLERVMRHLDAKPTDLERYIYLIALADRNQTLFYRTLMSDPARFVPIVPCGPRLPQPHAYSPACAAPFAVMRPPILA